MYLESRIMAAPEKANTHFREKKQKEPPPNAY